MKNLFKFTAAAVALFAFASCSDDVSEFGGTQHFTAANELKIEAEQMGGGSLTRSAYVGTTNARVWQETDEFKVFGPEIVGKYDYYKFTKSSNKFELNGSKDLTEAAYVAFPKENVFAQDWDKETGSGYIYYQIPATLNYDEVSGSDPVAYVSNLPLWGTAEADGDGIAAKVYFLTSIIKVYLTNALGNSSAVRIVAWNDIEGTEPARISGNAAVKVSENNTALSADKVAMPTPDGGNTIVVNLGDLAGKSANSVVYIPLVAGYYGKLDVEYYDNATTTWKNIRSYLDKTFTRATPYGKGNEKEFEIDASTISKVNDVLANMATSATGETVLTLQNDVTDFDDNLTIPAMSNVTTLTLNVPDFKDNEALTIEGDFAGTLKLNVAKATTCTGVTVKLKNANVVVGGAWADMGTPAFTINNAQNVQFGGLLNDDEEEIAADYSGHTITLKAGIGDVTVAEKAKVGNLALGDNHKTTALNVLGTAGTLTVNASSLASTMAVSVSGKSGAITISGATNNATVEVSGESGNITNAGTGAITVSGVAGAIENILATNSAAIALSGSAASITNAGTGAISITGNPVYKATTGYKVATVATKGNVTVNLDNEGAAIGTSLTFNAPATFTLTQGYVKAITVNAGADDSEVTCTLGNGYVTLPKPTLTKGKFTVSNVPTWNGEVIGGSFDKAEEVTAIKALVGEANYEAPTNWNTYVDANDAVYTPIGLAMQIGAAAITLANDINLNNQTWTPAVSQGAFEGALKTIKNLTVAVPADGAAASAATAGLGLFSELKHDVKNLTLDGVTIAAAEYTTGTTKYQVSNIGALAGKLTAAKTISNVEIKNISLSSTDGGNTIGGVIGTNTAAATLNGVIVSGTNAIQGYHCLGGLVGTAAADVTVATILKDADLYGTTKAAANIVSNATVSFTANFDSKESNDLNYQKVGNFIGTINPVTAVVTVTAASVNPTLTYNHTIFGGTMGIPELVGDKLTIYDIVFGQSLIGYCGTTQFADGAKPTLNTNKYQLYLTKNKVDELPAIAQFYLYYKNKTE